MWVVSRCQAVASHHTSAVAHAADTDFARRLAKLENYCFKMRNMHNEMVSMDEFEDGNLEAHNTHNEEMSTEG